MRPLAPQIPGKTPMSERVFEGVSGLPEGENAELLRQIGAHNFAESYIRDRLRGRKVRFKGWFTGGIQRTGTIVEAVIHGKHVSLGVDVDRIDGRPGFARREGVLADTWYGPVDSVEVSE